METEMSAFLCDDEHLKQLAAWLCCGNHDHINRLAEHVGYKYADWPKPGPDFVEADNLASFIATVLLRENERSLAAQYGDEMRGAKLTVTLGEVLRMERAELAAIAKAAACYEYQACESSDYDSTLAARIVAAIRARILTKLPGYEAANWGKPCVFERAAPEVVSLMSLASRQ